MSSRLPYKEPYHLPDAIEIFVTDGKESFSHHAPSVKMLDCYLRQFQQCLHNPDDMQNLEQLRCNFRSGITALSAACSTAAVLGKTLDLQEPMRMIDEWLDRVTFNGERAEIPAVKKVLNDQFSAILMSPPQAPARPAFGLQMVAAISTPDVLAKFEYS